MTAATNHFGHFCERVLSRRIIQYRLDPKNPRRFTADEQRRLDRTPIDYSDIPPLDEQFFSKAGAMPEINWSQCPEVERTDDALSGAWRIKGRRVPVSAILDNYTADETPLSIARMFGLPVATVRKVLHFGLSADLAALYDERRLPLWPRDYELEGVIIRHKLTVLDTYRRDAYRRRKLARQLAEIDKGLKRRRQP